MLRTNSILASALCLCLLAPAPLMAQGYGNTGRDSSAAPAPAEPPARPTLPNILTQGAKPPVRPESPRLAPAQRAECAWLGKRVILVLLRDDLIATKGFLEIYSNFGCPIQHIGQAFGCSTPVAGQTQANDMKAWVDACWDNPDIKPLKTFTDDNANRPRTPAPANSSRPDAAPRQ